MNEEYEEVVREVYELQKFRGKISLEPIRELMGSLNHPEKDFPAVHVAGSNGKGSTATIIARILEEEGYRTGLFTSPHLVDFRERMKVNGEKISRGEVVRGYGRVSDADVDASFFECMTGMAFDHFSLEEVDVAVVETGMGGRLDATNVVEPEVSVVTNVAREHTRWLGETPEQIAYELAGIVKEGNPVVSGVEGAPARIIEMVAADRGAPIRDIGRRAELIDSDSFNLELCLDGEIIDTNLVGRYQVDNVNTALAAVETIPWEVSQVSLRNALEEVEIPGRMEPVYREPLLLLDGAHNPAAVGRIPETLEEVDDGKTVAVVSIMGDKDYGEMLSTIEEFSDLLILSEAGIDRAAGPEGLASCVESVDHEVVSSIPEALDTALDVSGPGDTVLVTGSLYFVGDVKKVVGERMALL